MRALIIMLMAVWPVFAFAQSSDVPDPEAETRADMAEARASEIAKVLMTSPALMQNVVNNALRENPDVVKTIIRDTLLRNPDIVVGALQEFQRQQQAGTAGDGARVNQDIDSELAMEMRSGENAYVGGNPDGTVTITEFFDYNCGYCRRFAPIMDSLIETNDHLRVVYREWPILSQDSVDVARIALAAREQGGYEVLHDAFIAASGQLDADRALKIAGDLGLDTDKLEKDAEHPVVTQHLSRSIVLAEKAGFEGTPSMLIGDRFARGLVSADQIQPILDRFKVK